MYAEAVQSYGQAYEFAHRFLGPKDHITKNFERTYENAKEEISRKIQDKKMKEDKMQHSRARQRAVSANKKRSYV